MSPTLSPFPHVVLTFSLLLEGQEQPRVQDIFLWLPAVVSGKGKNKMSRNTRRAVTSYFRKQPEWGCPIALQSLLGARAQGCWGRVPPSPTRGQDELLETGGLEANTLASNSKGNHHLHPQFTLGFRKTPRSPPLGGKRIPVKWEAARREAPKPWPGSRKGREGRCRMQGGEGRGAQQRSPKIKNNVAGAQVSAGQGTGRGKQRKKSGGREETGNGWAQGAVNRAPSGDAKHPSLL